MTNFPPMLQRLYFLIAAICLLNGCQPSIPGSTEDIPGQEQLYIDARHGFAINIPQSWKRMDVTVSSPTYREDTVAWKLEPTQQSSTLFTVFTAPVSEFPDLRKFSQASFAIIHKKERENSASNEISGHLIHDNGEILYTNIIRKYHYYHLALTSSGSISKKTKEAFSTSVESLQEIAP